MRGTVQDAGTSCMFSYTHDYAGLTLCHPGFRKEHMTRRTSTTSCERRRKCATSQSARLLFHARESICRTFFLCCIAHLKTSKNSYHDTPFVYLPHFEEALAKWKTLKNKAEKVQFAQGRVAARNQRSLVKSCNTARIGRPIVYDASQQPIQALKAWQAAESNNRTEELENIRKARYER